MKRISAILGVSVFVLSFASPVSAHHKQEVLGDATESAEATMPATTEGPGLLLPDSPFFFLDTLKQNMRLLLAFTPEKKAELHAEIAGERLAELRFELIKNNSDAANTALEGIAEHLQKSAEELATADLQGKDVTELAQSLNEDFKSKRDVLDVLEDTSDGQLQARVNVVQKSLLEAKVKVEDSLPPSQLQNEIEEDLNHEVEDGVEDAAHSAKGLEHAIDILERNASDAATKNQTKRAAALRHAIEVKNDALRRQQEKGMSDDQKELDLTQDEIDAARATVKRAREAEQRFQEARRRKEELENDDSDESLTLPQTNTNVSGPGPSLNSGPGSLNSGPGGDY